MQMALERCREILGVDSDASEAAILAAFRERSKQVHPDRFQALDEDFRSLAHEKFIELKRARDRLLAIIERSGDHGSGREKN
jgi:curved DNA-binding protein CbpA